MGSDTLTTPTAGTAERGPVSRPEQVDPQAIVVSHWFDPGDQGDPYSAIVRLTGRRRGVTDRPTPGDSFTKDEAVEGIVPGTGPIAVTSWVYGVRKGEWDVTAQLTGPAMAHGAGPRKVRGGAAARLPRAAWSWRRWSLSGGPTGPVETRWALLAPLARSPAVLPGAFTALAVLAIILAIVVQAALLARLSVPVGGGVLASVAALLAGLLGAKLWYVALKGGPWQAALGQGWTVDGFLVVAPIVAVLFVLALGLPVGTYLDATAPGLFLAVAIGRVGCFVTGCCAGRCTASRWGVWSSDRRVGARRIPAQLIESGIGLALGMASALALLGGIAGHDGLVFVVALIGYAIARQWLLRLRAESRRYSWQRSRLATQAGS